MRVALLEKPHHLVVTEKTLRSLADDEVCVEIAACGICGTDVHIVEGTSRSSPPVVLGHEFTGTVADKGVKVNSCFVGDRVAVDPNISCGRCFHCRRGEVHLCEQLRALGVDIDGGMAEFCIVPASQLYLLPETMPSEVAVFVEPLSCAVRGIDRAHIRSGDTVVILGGGTVGLLLLQLARLEGAVRIIVVEPVEWKRAIASRLGADVVIDPSSQDVGEIVKSLTGVGADTVIECAGRLETVALSFELVRRGGTVELFGVCPRGDKLEIEPNAIYSKELTVVGSYVNPHTFDRAIALLAAGRVAIEPLAAQKFPLARVHDALAALREGNTIKSLIVPGL